MHAKAPTAKKTGNFARQNATFKGFVAISTEIHDVLGRQKNTIKHDSFEARWKPVATPPFFGISLYENTPPPGGGSGSGSGLGPGRHLPAGAQHLPAGARHLPARAWHLPAGARNLPAKMGTRTALPNPCPHAPGARMTVVDVTNSLKQRCQDLQLSRHQCDDLVPSCHAQRSYRGSGRAGILCPLIVSSQAVYLCSSR